MRYKILLLISIIVTSCGIIQKSKKEIVIKDELSISIPKKMRQLDSKALELKYFNSEFKPNLEFFNPKDSTILTVSYDANPLDEQDIEEIRIWYVNSFKEIYPEAEWINTQTIKINSITIANIETKDKNTYQMIFFTSLHGKQVHFVIQGSIDFIESIQPMARDVYHSIKIKN